MELLSTTTLAVKNVFREQRRENKQSREDVYDEMKFYYFGWVGTRGLSTTNSNRSYQYYELSLEHNYYNSTALLREKTERDG